MQLLIVENVDGLHTQLVEREVCIHLALYIVSRNDASIVAHARWIVLVRFARSITLLGQARIRIGRRDHDERTSLVQNRDGQFCSTRVEGAQVSNDGRVSSGLVSIFSFDG